MKPPRCREGRWIFEKDKYVDHAWVNIAIGLLMRNIGRADFRIKRDGEFVVAGPVYELFRDWNPWNAYRGVNPLVPLSLEIEQDFQANRANTDLLRNDAIPQGLLKTDQAVRPEEADQLEARWEQKYGRGGQHKKIAVLGRGTEFQHLSFSPEVVKFFELKRWNLYTEGKIEALKATIGALRDQLKGTPLSAKELSPRELRYNLGKAIAAAWTGNRKTLAELAFTPNLKAENWTNPKDVTWDVEKAALGDPMGNMATNEQYLINPIYETQIMTDARKSSVMMDLVKHRPMLGPSIFLPTRDRGGVVQHWLTPTDSRSKARSPRGPRGWNSMPTPWRDTSPGTTSSKRTSS